MTKFIIKMILPLIKKYLIKEMINQSNKTFVINKLNELIDIPDLNENAEREVIENLYNVLEKLLESYLETKN